MPLVEPVLGVEPPVARTVLDTAAHCMGRGGDQLFGKLLVERVGVGIADENPDEAEALLGRERLHRDGSADAAVGAIGDDGDQFAVAEPVGPAVIRAADRSEEHTSELPSLIRNTYAVFWLKKKKHYKNTYLA